MRTKKQYYKIYPDGNYMKYVFDHYKRKLKKYFIDVPYNTYLCIRFPFLYPRNRFSDAHYTNWKLREKQRKIFEKWSNYSKAHVQDYISKFGDKCIFMDAYVKTEYVMCFASFKDRFLYRTCAILERFLSIFHCLPSYSELDDMPDGWRKRFGIQFCKELKEAIHKCKDKTYRSKFRIVDIKEKFGTLRVYVNLCSDEVDRVIQKYEYISQYVCVTCGEDAVKKTTGWICPYCEKCLPDNQIWVWIQPIYGWTSSDKEKYNKEVYDEIDDRLQKLNEK